MVVVGGYPLAKLVSSGALRADEPILEASMKMAAELALGRQSGQGVNTGTGRGASADAGVMKAG